MAEQRSGLPCTYCVEGHDCEVCGNEKFIYDKPSYTILSGQIMEGFCPMCDEEIKQGTNPCQWCQTTINWTGSPEVPHGTR